MQKHQSAWAWQWKNMYDDNKWLFTEWISPHVLEDFRGKDVLDCGCGGGQHVNFVAPVAAHVTGVDLNALDAARRNTANLNNVTLIEADIASMDLRKRFDIVYSIGVLHHTDHPRKSFENIARHCKPGGLVIVWVYSHEGNVLNEYLLEPLKRLCIDHLPRSSVMGLAHLLTALLYLPIHTLYLLPLRFLPFYEYFQNWRRLSYRRNLLNVFDKLNAPQTWFIAHGEITSWFNPDRFTNIHISRYKGVSWRASGAVRSE